MTWATWQQYGFQSGREPRDGFVYLWMYAPAALAKIGFSIDPERRLQNERSKIRRRSGGYKYFKLVPELVTLVAAIPGSEADESRIQDDCPAFRVPDSEWFKLTRPCELDWLSQTFNWDYTNTGANGFADSAPTERDE